MAGKKKHYFSTDRRRKFFSLNAARCSKFGRKNALARSRLGWSVRYEKTHTNTTGHCSGMRAIANARCKRPVPGGGGEQRQFEAR